MKDFNNPPYTVVGSNSARALNKMKELYGHLPGDFLVTHIRTAETIKYFCNIFHALKITFSNEVGRLCESLQVNPYEVMDLLCQDRQLNISSAYMKPGFAFGGSCLPKDLRAIQYLAKHADIEIPMLAKILESNRLHVAQVIDKILATGKRKIGMLGLSFKTGTDDLRESPLVTLAEQLIGKGMELTIYDPQVNLSRLIGANKRFIEQSIPHIGSLMTQSLDTVLYNNELFILGINDAAVKAKTIAALTPESHLVDLIYLEPSERPNCHYLGACW